MLIRKYTAESARRTVYLAVHSAAVFTGSASIFKMPLFVRSVWLIRTVQTAVTAGKINQVIPINLWIKKLFSGEIPTSCISNCMSAMITEGSHRINEAESRIGRIFHEKNLLALTMINSAPQIITVSAAAAAQKRTA